MNTTTRSISTNRRLQWAYDRIASDYARTNAVSSVEYRDHFGPALLRCSTPLAAPVPPRLLDIGCGAGRDMAQFEAAGAQVVGVDLSSGMLAEARVRASGPLVQMDMRALGFASETFHGVWCAASLLHLPKIEAPTVLQEIHRILTAGGVLFLAVQAGEGERWETGAYGHPVERFFARYSPEEIVTLLAEHGFAVREHDAGDAGVRRWLRFLATRR